MTTTEFKMNGGASISYEVFDDGFDIWIGSMAGYPTYSQREPFIPDKSLSYEENAVKMCEQISKDSNQAQSDSKTAEERLTNIEANIDYLMLLNDADSIDASEE